MIRVGDIGYMNIETGELLSKTDMLSQFKTEYDGDDPTNCLGWDEYYEEVILNGEDDA